MSSKMKITDLTNNSPFIDLNLDEAADVFGGKRSRKGKRSPKVTSIITGGSLDGLDLDFVPTRKKNYSDPQ